MDTNILGVSHQKIVFRNFRSHPLPEKIEFLV